MTKRPNIVVIDEEWDADLAEEKRRLPAWKRKLLEDCKRVDANMTNEDLLELCRKHAGLD